MRPFLVVLGLAVIVLIAVAQASGAFQTAQRSESSAVLADKPAAASNALPNAQAPIPEVASAQKPNTTIQPERWPDETLFVREQNGLVAYSMANGQQRFTLPKGMLSADGKTYFVAQPYPYPGDAATIVTIFDPGTGKPYYKFPVSGRWELSGVSHTGRWVALTRMPSESEKEVWTKANTWQTDVQIVDTSDGKVAHTLKLAGNFEVETISSSGDALFMIEHQPAINPDHYVIRLYDLSAEQLKPGALRAPMSSDDVMAGYAWEGVASPDGRWLLTLYLSTKRNVAFVHALNLRERYPVCVDLPSGSGDGSSALTTSFDLLKQYTLTLSPDGYKLFAANAALGVVAHIDLSSYPQVVRTERFTARDYAAPKEFDPQSPSARSVISKDGSKLYFTSGWDVWGYDTKYGKVDGPYLINAQITGLGLSSDGKRLYVASQNQPLAVFDTANGSELKFPRVAVSRSIE